MNSKLSLILPTPTNDIVGDQEEATETLFRRYLATPRPRYQIVTNALTGKTGIGCAGCHRISWNAMDVQERFCLCLHIFHDTIEKLEDEGRKLLGDKDHGP